MSENALRYRTQPRRRPAKQKRRKPKLTPEHIEHAHRVLRRELKRRGLIAGQNKKDAAWHIRLTGNDLRMLGRQRRLQVVALTRALYELEQAGTIRHNEAGGYRLAKQQAA